MKEHPELGSACRNTVALAMRELGLKSRVSRSFTPTTTPADPTRQPAPNVLAQDFTATAPDCKWVPDITYLANLQGWVYLAVVLDLFSRKVVGWAMSHSLATKLVSAALRRAAEARRPTGRDLLHDSDRGCQCSSHDYQHTLQTLGIQCSMSRTGCCYDNAVRRAAGKNLPARRTDASSVRASPDGRGVHPTGKISSAGRLMERLF